MAKVDRNTERMNLWPLPGGRANYTGSLRRVLSLANDVCTIAELGAAIRSEFPEVTSPRTARGYAKVPVALGLLRYHPSGAVKVSPEGQAFIRTGNHAIVRDALVTHVAGIVPILKHLDAGAEDFNQVRARLEEDDGLSWVTPMPVRYRIWWLASSGALEPKQDGRRHRLVLTRAGRSLLRDAS